MAGSEPGAAAAGVREEELFVDGIRVFLRRTDGEGLPTVFVHGHPTHSEDWLAFMARLRGPSIALDLPGWGRSEAPPAHRLRTSMDGLGAFLGRFLDAAGIGDHQLVCHDWGAVSLITAQADPGRVRRLVVLNAVPLLPGYRWHRIARYLWRPPLVGELANLTASRAALRLISRGASATPGPMAASFIDRTWDCWPRGTWPQALALYRSADPAALAEAGARLDLLDCPALVAWGLRDPYLPARFGREYARRLPDAQLREFAGAGHWPWIDDPLVIESVCEFLAG